LLVYLCFAVRFLKGKSARQAACCKLLLLLLLLEPLASVGCCQDPPWWPLESQSTVMTTFRMPSVIFMQQECAASSQDFKGACVFKRLLLRARA